jgi:catechol 2,3-dioxygenase-like lactoylglutathione lyase family enzyme
VVDLSDPDTKGEPMTEVTTGPPAPQRETLPSFFTIKLGVTDFDRTIDFYGRLFGMTPGPVWDEVRIERALEWPDEGHGPVIIMFNETAVAEQGVSEGGSDDPVLGRIVSGEHPFRAGSSWMCFQVEDINQVAAELAAMGQAAEIRDVGDLGFQMLIIMTTDPDGNVLEITPAY